MSEVKIFLLRHAETYNNIHKLTQTNRDIPLAQEGILHLSDNLKQIVETLDGKQLAVFTSYQKRACQTAEMVLGAMAAQGIQPVVTMAIEPLREVDFGKYSDQPEGTIIDGSSMADLRTATMNYYKTGTDFCFPEGEYMSQVSERCKKVIAMLKNFKKVFEEGGVDTNILVVGHCRLFRHLLVELGQWPIEKMFDNKIHNATLYELETK
jgi:broad specificity phosphatase PhoE